MAQSVTPVPQKHGICFNIPIKLDRDSRLRVTRRAFYLQGGAGISANTCLLSLRLAAILRGQKPRLRDLPITHLALAHIVLLVIVALLVSTDIWVVQDIPSDVKCKMLVFLHKVMRELSLGTTCVLSVLQALTISASGSLLADFKVKSANPILGACLFLWVLTMAIISDQLLCRVATPCARQPGLLFVNSHCSFLLRYRGVFLLLAAPQTSPEHRATPSDLQLLDCFATLYCADSALSLLISGMRRNVPMLWSIHNTVTSGYGMLSPLVLLRADTKILNIKGAQ
ncbi:putative vomeronasal receptor-like protein 4 [Ictidomys tridecemlineatus]